MLRGLLKREGNASSHSLNSLAEPQNLEAAMRAATCIMNDDLKGAEDGLEGGHSTFHKLGKGMVAFLRATLGFEPEVMREASEKLADAEASASADHRRAQRDSHAFHSSIYPPGSEFALCHAETQLMGAVIGVLNESLTESIKGFYKLRKAYTTLDSILAAEARFMKDRNGPAADTAGRTSVEHLRSPRSTGSLRRMAGAFDDGKEQSHSGPPSIQNVGVSVHPNSNLAHETKVERHVNGGHHEEMEDEDEFFDAEDTKQNEVPTMYTGRVEINGVATNLAKLSLGDDSRPSSSDLQEVTHMPVHHGLLDHDPDSDVFSNPIDIFVHSGANLCFGLLLLMISMIPPAFGRLLYIIGFHGDKERGVRMLWQASKFHNVNGSFAGLILLGYYNTLVGFSDIIPDRDSDSAREDAIEGYPKERCEALLAEMRSRNPKSHLWLLEEARMRAANRHLSEALDLLTHTSKTPFKQVEALEMFETALNAMYSHNYDLCSKSFLACVTLNNWSHALYYYIAGAAELEQYRKLKTTDPDAASVYAKKATEHFRQAPLHAGKKRFMARQLPFDVLVTRKLRKWEARAHEWNVPLVEAAGVSPLEEMIFFWNGYKRMNDAQLNTSLDILSQWSKDPVLNPHWAKEHADEHAIIALLRAATLRNLHRLDEARDVVRRGILDVDRNELKGGLRDDWTAPAAHYEMGAECWMRRSQAAQKGEGLDVQEKWVKECEGWVEKAAKWESYELDARIGLKIATAQDTLKRWRETRGLALGTR